MPESFSIRHRPKIMSKKTAARSDYEDQCPQLHSAFPCFAHAWSGLAGIPRPRSTGDRAAGSFRVHPSRSRNELEKSNSGTRFLITGVACQQNFSNYRSEEH